MDWSKLSSSDKTAAVAALVVVVTAVISVALQWGYLMVVSLLAGLGVLAIVFQPQVRPAMALPGSRGSLLLGLGVIAAAATILAGLPWFGYITRNLISFDVLQFLVGLVAAVVLAWTGWQAFQAEGGKFRIGMSGPPSSA
jgi:hypothetical protein